MEICAISHDHESVIVIFIIESRLEDVFSHDVEYAALETNWVHVKILNCLKFASDYLRNRF